ncbi:septum site-determining protein MinC [Paenalkalicoccus suaedae]|uniref:Probable septum site-determining protein MinC n=1 Tax=Paenalkalicoccus suaedae TaxID=2592382 RepID=A0A859FGQ8_9BACI|nr:septum site-determining protein MinC [Paenalkalicoccus suaedae]QKS71844.1 septum site-determining protein MinC [Paenalkalicoccus suaedae]
MGAKQARQIQHVWIKGTRDGLTFQLDDQCSFQTIKAELQDRLAERPETANSDAMIEADISLGNRYITQNQRLELEAIFAQSLHIQVGQFHSNVITKEEALNEQKEKQVTQLVKVIRSGQVEEFHGDVVLIGDVNQGATLKATGNIHIVGSLRGIAHAGSTGREDAVISASFMRPTQLRIASIIRRAPDEEEWGGSLEFAYLSEDGDIHLEKVQKLGTIRPKLRHH